MTGLIINLIVVIFFFILLFAGTPVAIVMGFTTLIYLVARHIPLMVMAHRLMFVLDSFPLLAVTLFIFAGKLVNEIKVTDRIFAFARALVGRFPGGLGHVNAVASLIFAGMSGSALADIGGLGQIELKAMKDAGYPDDFSAGITIASSSIGPIFPPSIGVVIYAVMAGASVTRLLLAGVVPGILMCVALMVACYFIARKRNYPRDPRVTLRQFVKITWRGLPALFTPMILLGGIVSGIFSPTEAAMVTIIYAFVLGVVYREVNWKNIRQVCADTVRTSASVLFIFATAMLISWVLAMEQMPQAVSSLLGGIIGQPTILLLTIIGIYLVLGCFMDEATMLMLITPMLIPIARSAGINLTHFGLVVILASVCGLYTPPVGMGLYLGSKVAGISFARVTKATFPFLLAIIAVLIFIALVPNFVLFFPNLVLGK